MNKIEEVEKLVKDLYKARNPNREGWADWLSENHVFIVADNSSELARRFGANQELSRAAALLHDIADTKMSRFAQNHEEESLAIARDIMHNAGFSEDEIKLTVDDAIRFHSCHDGHKPDSTEGKVLATADAKAHLMTDFYIYIAWAKGKDGQSLEEVKQFGRKKIERDFNDKICFDEIREQCRPSYNSLKNLFS